MKTFLFICVASLVICFNNSFAQWEELGIKNGLPDIATTSYYGLAVDGKNIITNTFGELYVSTNNGDNWELTNYKPGQKGSLTYICGMKDSNIFITVFFDYQVSHDLGKTWKMYSDTSHAVANAIIFNGDVGIMGGCCSLYETTDFGETFKRVLGQGWSNDGYSPMLLKDGYFFAEISIYGGNYRSKDNGHTWDPIYPPIIPSNGLYGSYGRFLSIKNLIIGFEVRSSFNSAILSTDNGDTWVVKENYPKIIERFQDIISCGNNLYGIGGANEGVFISRDTGQTWSSFNIGLRLEGDYQGIALAHDDKYLYATYIRSFGRGGLFRAKLKDCEIDFSTDVADNISNISEFLSPNPASDFIEISYTPLERGSGGVRIYNVLGEIQTTPSLRDTPPYQGGEKVRINVSGLAPGMYFVRIGDKVSKFVKI